MPLNHTLDIFKIGRGGPQFVCHCIVELQEHSLQLRHNNILVITLVTNNGSPVDTRKILCSRRLTVAGEIGAQAKMETVGFKHVRLVSGSTTIDAIQIKP